MRYCKVLLFLWIVLSCVSCNRAESAINQLDSFSQRVISSSSSWSDADWDDALQYADELTITLSECSLSEEQLRRVDAINAEFWPLFVRHYWEIMETASDSLPQEDVFFQSIHTNPIVQ